MYIPYIFLQSYRGALHLASARLWWTGSQHLARGVARHFPPGSCQTLVDWQPTSHQGSRQAFCNFSLNTTSQIIVLIFFYYYLSISALRMIVRYCIASQLSACIITVYKVMCKHICQKLWELARPYRPVPPYIV